MLPINLIPIIFFLFSVIGVQAQVASSSNELSESSFVSVDKTAEMYYIYVKESKNHKELFPKLYPIGFIVKEKAQNGKRTTYMLGEFDSMDDAEEALVVVKSSGYPDARIITKKM